MTEQRSEPGLLPGSTIHYGMSFEDYCELDGINASALKGVGGCSPLHLKAYLDGDLPSNDTKDKRLGRAIHSMLLEPHLFDEAFPTASQCWATVEPSKKGEESYRCKNQGYHRNNDLWYCGVHGKKFPEVMDYVTHEERLRMAALEASMKRDPSMELLRRPGKSEVVIQWEQFGLLLKTRIDRIAVDGNEVEITDIKKCRVGYGDDKTCQRECADKGYHIQAWFHRAGTKAVYGDSISIQQWFLFAEDSFPFCTNAMPVDDEDLAIAEFQARTALERFKACQRTGQYFGYQLVLNPEKSGVLPGWFKREFEEVFAPSEIKGSK